MVGILAVYGMCFLIIGFFALWVFHAPPVDEAETVRRVRAKVSRKEAIRAGQALYRVDVDTRIRRHGVNGARYYQ